MTFLFEKLWFFLSEGRLFAARQLRGSPTVRQFLKPVLSRKRCEDVSFIDFNGRFARGNARLGDLHERRSSAKLLQAALPQGSLLQDSMLPDSELLPTGQLLRAGPELLRPDNVLYTTTRLLSSYDLLCSGAKLLRRCYVLGLVGGAGADFDQPIP